MSGGILTSWFFFQLSISLICLSRYLEYFTIACTV
eukprot:CAMPEP_0182582816 /NCGR_PEP_ID=MMETSP1324-20130603/53618_1 /TAXON_ID=236786 /ORGANISM="Florenciella sp., Strain RCC1587" /LENGTH=34 /DNA_ID= /DNA_START= /DNA_END= /DNA_ORIENTATION=